jgi:hypothetical protein
MTKLDSILSEKMQQKSHLRIKTLAERSLDGHLFALLGKAALSAEENTSLEAILEENRLDSSNVVVDLAHLQEITAEIKTINTQAALLHGERIKRAQTLLKEYKEGAFSTWLVQTYGNRQTPYNFLQYFEFYQSLAIALRERMLQMPKQAVYTLASRSGDVEKKREIVEEYEGETKEELLTKIRTLFPLDAKDKRKENLSDVVISTLRRVLTQIEEKEWSPSLSDSREITHLLKCIQSSLKSK